LVCFWCVGIGLGSDEKEGIFVCFIFFFFFEWGVDMEESLGDMECLDVMVGDIDRGSYWVEPGGDEDETWRSLLVRSEDLQAMSPGEFGRGEERGASRKASGFVSGVSNKKHKARRVRHQRAINDMHAQLAECKRKSLHAVKLMERFKQERACLIRDHEVALRENELLYKQLEESSRRAMWHRTKINVQRESRRCVNVAQGIDCSVSGGSMLSLNAF